jgi:2-hydroxychromene-2-carboxylate isomerase
MKRISFYLDFISPFAYLAFERLPIALEGLSWQVEYKPVLFGALLKHNGQLGPAEIPGKKEWTFRQVLWLARQYGIPFELPAAHPFNPLELLRLSVACGSNRHVCEQVFRHVWRAQGQDAADPQRLVVLRDALEPKRDPASPQVKAELKANTDQAVATGVFGVPTFEVDGKLFWGLDALPMLLAYLKGDAWFGSGAWDAALDLPAGVVRQR